MNQTVLKEIESRMSGHLNEEQMRMLHNVLVSSLPDTPSMAWDDGRILESFISAKRIEGCSERTLKYYSSTIAGAMARMGKQACDVTTDDLRIFLAEYQGARNVSRVTIDNIRRIMSSFFSWLVEEDHLLKNPVRRIKRVRVPKVVKEVYSDEDIELMRDGCTEKRDRAIIDLLSSTGMRVGELVRLNREDVDLNNRECIVLGKGDKERPVYFDAKSKVHITEYLDSRTDANPALFVSLDSPHERLSIAGVESRLRELGNRLGIGRVHPHKFRRTLATRAIDKGMPIEQVQHLLGHQKIDTTLEYAMVNQNNVKASHRRFIG